MDDPTMLHWTESTSLHAKHGEDGLHLWRKTCYADDPEAVTVVLDPNEMQALQQYLLHGGLTLGDMGYEDMALTLREAGYAVHPPHPPTNPLACQQCGLPEAEHWHYPPHGQGCPNQQPCRTGILKVYVPAQGEKPAGSAALLGGLALDEMATILSASGYLVALESADLEKVMVRLAEKYGYQLSRGFARDTARKEAS